MLHLENRIVFYLDAENIERSFTGDVTINNDVVTVKNNVTELTLFKDRIVKMEKLV